jgi:hypothetical protein
MLTEGNLEMLIVVVPQLFAVAGAMAMMSAR